MEEIAQWLLNNLGPYGLAAFLCWYIISNQAKQNEALNTRNEKLQDKLTELMTESNTVLRELTIRLEKE